MAVSKHILRKAKSVKALETLRDSPDASPTQINQAIKTLHQIDSKHVEKQAKPLESMTRAEIQGELQRMRGVIAAIPL